MAPSAKHLPFKHKELGSFPIIRIRTVSLVWCCPLAFPEMERWREEGLRASQPRLASELQANDRPCLKK